MKPVVISFFSDVDGKTYYSDHAARFMGNCNYFNIKADVREKASLGSYQANCRSKPQFILERMHAWKSPVIWMDIDTLIHKPLRIFDDMPYDVVFASSFVDPKYGTIVGPEFECRNEWAAGHNPETGVAYPADCLKASPIYLNYTPNAISFVEQWIESIEKNNENWFDHESLFDVTYANQKEMNIKFLPWTYCASPGCRGYDTVLSMGLADVDSKIKQLRHNGFDEENIEGSSPGNRYIEKDIQGQGEKYGYTQTVSPLQMSPKDPLGRHGRQ